MGEGTQLCAQQYPGKNGKLPSLNSRGEGEGQLWSPLLALTPQILLQSPPREGPEQQIFQVIHLESLFLV